MFNMTRTRAGLIATCLAYVAIVAASSALAKDEQSQNNQQNLELQPAQTNQQSSEQPSSTTVEQQTSDQLDQQNAQQEQQVRQGEQSNQHDSSSRHGSESIEGTNGNQSYQISHSDETSGNSQSKRQQSRGQQGASLGVNIIGGENGQGVSITRVHSDTPAQQMGLRSGDRITSVNGAPVRSSDEFISTIRRMNPGDGIELTIIRDNAEQTIAGQLEPYGQAIARNPEASGNDEFRNYQGIINRGRASADQWSRNAAGNYSGEFSRDRSPSGQFRSDEDQVSRDAQRSANLQTSYEDRGPSNGPPSGDVDARLRRVEEQLDRISQDIEELRNTVGTVHPSSGLREAASDEYRSNNQQTRPRANQPQPNGQLIKKNDRWNSSENRFDSGDVAGARSAPPKRRPAVAPNKPAPASNNKNASGSATRNKRRPSLQPSSRPATTRKTNDRFRPRQQASAFAPGSAGVFLSQSQPRHFLHIAVTGGWLGSSRRRAPSEAGGSLRSTPATPTEHRNVKKDLAISFFICPDKSAVSWSSVLSGQTFPTRGPRQAAKILLAATIATLLAAKSR